MNFLMINFKDSWVLKNSLFNSVIILEIYKNIINLKINLKN